MSLWVNEAKDLPPKRSYYCELHLDGTLFARTTSRAVGKQSNRSSLAGDGSIGSSGGLGASATGGCQLFWGEFFELDNLPGISQISLHLFREEDAKKKRHSRDEASLHPLGSVAIPLSDVQGRTYQEKWYPIIPYKSAGTTGNKDLPGPQALLRIRARFQNLLVLPMEKYKEFAEYVTVDYMEMCQSLEPLLNVKEKEELAGALVHVLQSIGKAKVSKMHSNAIPHHSNTIYYTTSHATCVLCVFQEFLIDLGSAEIEHFGDKEALIFRQNTLATKAIDEYMKLVGQKYLIDTLGRKLAIKVLCVWFLGICFVELYFLFTGDFINRLYASVENCEVDPRKCPASELANNQKHLREACEEVVQKIIELHG